MRFIIRPFRRLLFIVLLLLWAPCMLVAVLFAEDLDAFIDRSLTFLFEDVGGFGI